MLSVVKAVIMIVNIVREKYKEGCLSINLCNLFYPDDTALWKVITFT